LPTLTLSFKGRILKVFPVGAGEVVIGNDPECEVHIDSLALEPQHASVTTDDQGTVLRDLGSESGTYVNNERVKEHPLQDNDQIRIGKHTLVFARDLGEVEEQQTPGATPEPPAESDSALPHLEQPKTAWLQILNGQNLGKTISLGRKMTNLGKPGVQTAVIARRNDGYFLSHLEGEYPPTVGGQSIGDHSWALNDGDIVQIGNVKMQFYLQ
jgi:pSer/pThr/pTyr-binding forkhead associated (FHA) protein